MSDLLTVITAKAIDLAFQEFVKSGSGEIAKKSVGGAIELVKTLRNKIITRFKGNKEVELVIESAKSGNDLKALNKLKAYLDAEVIDDNVFASDLRHVVEEITNIQNQIIQSGTTYKQSAGRDILNIENIQGGSNKFGGS